MNLIKLVPAEGYTDQCLDKHCTHFIGHHFTSNNAQVNQFKLNLLQAKLREIHMLWSFIYLFMISGIDRAIELCNSSCRLMRKTPKCHLNR